MRVAHWANATLWLANANLWGWYAGNGTMLAASLCAASVAVWLAWRSDPWDYR